MNGIIAASYQKSGGTGFVTIPYTASTANIANPERGFYHHEETKASSYDPLNSVSLAAYRTGSDKITLILRLFYLDSFLGTNTISGTFLTAMQNDFDAIRTAGIKCIVRFAYSDTVLPVDTGNNPNKARIKLHIDQLESILEANKDVITCFQMGFIGTYGEWYYCDYFGYAASITAGQYADRKELAEYFLSKTPSERAIEVRTPEIKKRITGTSTALTEAQAFQDTPIARIGHHNDALMANLLNDGTYVNRTVDMAFISAESAFLPIIGESNTLNNNPAYGNICSNATVELDYLGYSAVNIDYLDTVVGNSGNWQTGGCRPQIRTNFGYRFSLVSGTYPTNTGGTLEISITIANTGYANPFNERETLIVLRDTTTSDEYPIQVNTDCRLWTASQILNEALDISSVPNGTYSLFLNLPDIILDTRPEYSIQMANTGTWESGTGYNNLNHTITKS